MAGRRGSGVLCPGLDSPLAFGLGCVLRSLSLTLGSTGLCFFTLSSPLMHRSSADLRITRRGLVPNRVFLKFRQSLFSFFGLLLVTGSERDFSLFMSFTSDATLAMFLARNPFSLLGLVVVSILLVSAVLSLFVVFYRPLTTISSSTA